MDETKTCENPPCGKTYARPPRQSRPAFAARKYCCGECKHEVVRAANLTGTRTCGHCGEKYTRRTRESRNEFEGRTFCSLACRYKADTGGHRRVQRRPNAALLPGVAREPGQVWRPAGFTREPNVFGTVRQGC
jgi:hypothetical protein